MYLEQFPKTQILIFDDLERVETTTLNEVLGFINTYTEHRNVKVILVGDESKLKNIIKGAILYYQRETYPIYFPL
jgi:nitrous oxide reductase accessory protein NosL